MTMVTINSEDPRSIKAVEIAAGAGQWLRCRTPQGAKAYGIPSQCLPGRYYLVDLEHCTCEDFKRNGLSADRRGQEGYHGPCKHILAVRLHCALSKAQQSKPRPRIARPAAPVSPPSPSSPMSDAQTAQIFGRL